MAACDGAEGAGDVRPRPFDGGGAEGYDASEGGGGGGTCTLGGIGDERFAELARGLPPSPPVPLSVADGSVLGRLAAGPAVPEGVMDGRLDELLSPLGREKL